VKHKDYFKIVLIFLYYILSCSFLFSSEVRPNIIWLFSDDHAVNAIGAYGGRLKEENLTPNIDTLAREGMTFNRCYVGNSICAPSRATLLTGKHSHMHGKRDNRGGFNHDQPQFQKVLRNHGYQTAMIGKIHLNGAMQGFDYWEVLPGQGRYRNPTFITAEGETKYEGHCTDIVTDRALNWLEKKRSKKKPFMAMIHYKAPHRNWMPAPRFREAFKNRTFPEPDTLFDDYKGRGTAAHQQDMSIETTMRLKGDLKANWPERKEVLQKERPTGKDLVRLKYQWYMRDYLACIAGVDENIGRILDYLKKEGLDKNTVVMYSSDQGFYLGEHGWFDKRFMYEESFRTPLIVRWPKVVSPGSRNSDLTQNIDFAETFLSIAGAPIPEDMQGRSLMPLLKGVQPQDWRTSLYYHYYEYPAYHHAVRRHEGVATDRYKLIRFYGKDVPRGEEWELYDLKEDPSEMKSLYGDPSQKERTFELQKELARLRKYYSVPDTDS